jgi:nitroimidazol reductase NimA-like FMN-containing flavoprotein (pyridoxamine 5'-phosphate oxidase superfamily)
MSGDTRMPLTNPWLTGPTPTKRLDRERLEERILNLLSSQNMCVLATTGPDGPLATPVRYYPLGFAVLFSASPRSPKMRNIAADPRVSVGIFAPLVGLASSRGAQLFGTAKVLDPEHPDRAHYWEAFRWENEHVERGRPLSEPPEDTLVVIEAERIVYTEHWLRREGFAPRQFWRR